MNEDFFITNYKFNIKDDSLLIYYKKNTILYKNEYLKIIIYDDFFNFTCYWISTIVDNDIEYWISTSLIPFSKVARIEIQYNNKTIFTKKIYLTNDIDLTLLEDFPFLLNYKKFNIDSSSLHDVFIKKHYDLELKVEKGDVVVDIGSNIGAFIYNAIYKSASKIYSCEPSVYCFDILEDLFKFFPQVQLNNAAISDKTMMKSLIMLDETNASNFLSDNNNITWHDKNKQTQQIQGYCFLDFIKKNNIDYIDFLKCDCEGGEHYIFTEENAEYISKKIDKIVLEYHGDNKNILFFLKKYDFNILKLEIADKTGIIHAKNNKVIIKHI
jgi:FkbM family methyltransferase